MTASQPLPLAELSPAEQAERPAETQQDDVRERIARGTAVAMQTYEAGYEAGYAAALAVMPASPAEEALRRVEALCDVADDQPDGYECRFIATDVIRAAIAAPQTGEER